MRQSFCSETHREIRANDPMTWMMKVSECSLNLHMMPRWKGLLQDSREKETLK
jgi:hypothetical protein